MYMRSISCLAKLRLALTVELESGLTREMFLLPIFYMHALMNSGVAGYSSFIEQVGHLLVTTTGLGISPRVGKTELSRTLQFLQPRAPGPCRETK